MFSIFFRKHLQKKNLTHAFVEFIKMEILFTCAVNPTTAFGQFRVYTEFYTTENMIQRIRIQENVYSMVLHPTFPSRAAR